MPSHRSTKDKLIQGVNAKHAEIIDRVTSGSSTSSTSTEHLLLSDSRLSVYSECHKEYYTLREPNGPSQSSSRPIFPIGEENYMQIEEEKKPPPSTLRTFKNLIVLGCAFMFMFTAFVSLQGLQSTLNPNQGLGVTSLSCVYGATVVSCFLAPTLISHLTTKWTIVLSYCLFLVYVLANVYPVSYSLIAASLLLGLSTGPLWSAQSTYLTTLAINYALTSRQLHESTINHFNGIFCGILQTSQIWGNLISASILSSNNQTVHLTSIRINVSTTRYVCGGQDCSPMGHFNADEVPHYLGPIPLWTRGLLLAFHIGCALLAISSAVMFLDKNEVNAANNGSMSLSSQQLFLATLQMLRDARLQLLFPIVVYTGLEQGFVMGDFTKFYVNCALGIHKIGHVLMCYGAVNAVSSLSIGHVAKHIKRMPIIVSGTVFNLGLLMVLLWWRPDLEDVPMFYVTASCLGLCDAIWQTQTNTVFGVLFSDHQEAAFACYRMFQAIGLALAFGYSHFLCVATKVYIMGGVLIVGLVLYAAIEFRLHQLKKFGAGIVLL